MELSTVPNAGLPAGFRKSWPNGDARMGAGIMFMTGDGKALFVRRRGGDHAGEWAFPGGHVEEDEEPADAARREAMEEVGRLPSWDLAPLHRETRDRVDFTTFGMPVAMEFDPDLNEEHDDHVWADPSSPPRPLHPGVAALLSKFFGEEAREQEHSGSNAAVELEKRFAGKKVGGTDSALVLAFDKGSTRSFDSDGRMRVSVANISKANICPYRGEEIPDWETLGLERDKVYQMYRDPRELEAAAATFNGIQVLKKHVAVDADDHQMWDIVGCTGTDAAFDGTYLTNSLSIWTQEGIDFIESGDQRELSCGYHYTPDMTPGSFGGSHYDGVMRSIEGNHVALVEEGRAGHDVVVGDSALEQKESDMNPTRLEYAVLMRTAAAINPLLAKDAKVDYGVILKGLTTKNFKQRRPVIMDSVRKAIDGKTIAKDASIEHLASMLDQFEHTPHAKKNWDESVSGAQHRAMEAAAHGHSNIGIPKGVGQEFEKADKGKTFGDMIRDWAKAKDWSEGGMSDDDYAALDKMHMDAMTPLEEGAGMDDEGEENVNIEVEEGEEGEDGGLEQEEGEDRRGRARDRRRKGDEEIEQEEAEGEDRRRATDRRHADDRRGAKDRRKGAMDRGTPITGDDMRNAIASAVAGERRRNQEMLEARALVRPHVGELPMTMAFDTAEKVLRAAAKVMRIDGADTVHPTALKPLIKMAGESRTMARDSKSFELEHDELAMDGDASATFDKFFPGASRIGTV